MRCMYLGSRKRSTALVALAALFVSSVALGGPLRTLKIENAGRYIQLGVHLLAPPDGMTHPIALPGVSWATPYTWAGAAAAAVNGSSQHLVAPHGEPVPGPLHTYALTVTPAIPPPRAVAFGRLFHGNAYGDPTAPHPDVFVEVLAASPTAAVFADIGVHDPPPGNCPGLGAAPTGEEVVPPTDSEAVAASTFGFYTPDGTLSVGIVVHGITKDQLIASAIHHGAEGTNGPPILDLGPGPEWTDLDGYGIARTIEDAPFPPEYIEALLHDETYINVCTMEHPEGEIRGQILNLPWDDDFDYYTNGSSMHGQGGWKGWDNDPAFTAYVTDAQSLSPPHSVDIAGDSDLVHEYSGYTSGDWTYTAWLYVPEDFNNGDPIMDPPGTYFLLLNTYNDGGPYNWSVQYNFDSNDGMLKVCYGNGQNTIDVPYITDQWVEIRADIDLDIDSCTLYYDGEFLATYTWTGGIYGNGGGALNIATVDLFANGATSVYYDDMSLQPYEPECPGDIDGDGDTDHSDLGELLAAWCTQEGDPNWNANADLDGDGHVGHGDLGTLLADWGCGT